MFREIPDYSRFVATLYSAYYSDRTLHWLPVPQGIHFKLATVALQDIDYFST